MAKDAAMMPRITSILHPTDFGTSSHAAFAHALAAALLFRAKLTIMHAGPERADQVDWGRYPGVRETLARWKLLDENSPRTAVRDKLGLKVDKVSVRRRDPVSGTLEFTREHPADLIVLSAHERGGESHWWQRTHAMTLFIPEQKPGFVARDNGDLSLRRILLPVSDHVDHGATVECATRMAKIFGEETVEIHLLQVGDQNAPAMNSLPSDTSWTWDVSRSDGEFVPSVVEAAADARFDLIVMAAPARSGILSAIRGDKTEAVLHSVACPVLAVPS